MTEKLEKEHKAFDEPIEKLITPKGKQFLESFLHSLKNKPKPNVLEKLQTIGVTDVQELHVGEYIPLSKELVITGGDDFEVAKVLYENVRWSGVAYLIGNRKINVDGFNIYFSRKED